MGCSPAAILRYVYPGVTPKNGRVVTIERDGGGRGEPVTHGGDIASALESDGVDLTRWRLRYYHKAHEGWMLLRATTEVEFHPSNRILLELALEPPQLPRTSPSRRRTPRVTDITTSSGERRRRTTARSGDPPGAGAAFIFSVGARFEKSSADTTKAWTSLPAYEYSDWNAFAASQPYSAAWVAVEMGGVPLEEFEHPDRAVYVLGSEDNGLPSSILRACAHHVSLPVGAEGRTAATTSPLRGRSCCSIDSRRGAGGGTEERKTRVSPEGARGWTA